MTALKIETQRVVSVEIPKEHITADAAIVVCIDPRWWNRLNGNKTSALEAFIEKKKWRYVPLTSAGGAKVLASEAEADAEERESLLGRIVRELGLHKPPILALTAHRDCGAYGYFDAFGNDAEKENERLYADLEKASAVVEKRLGEEREKARRESRSDGHLHPKHEFYVFDLEGVEQVKF